MKSSRILKSEGIVISRTNYGEADRLIKVFSKDYGKLMLLAKGARKAKSKKRGSIEVFSKLKFSAYRRNGIGVLTEALLSDFYLDVRKNLKKVSLSYFLLEVVDSLTRMDESNVSNSHVYEILVDTFNDLKKRSDLRTIKKEFSIEILATLGFWTRDKFIENPENLIESLVEKKLNSVRVGRSLFF